VTGCIEGCGMCCERVYLHTDAVKLLLVAAEGTGDERSRLDAIFTTRHWHWNGETSGQDFVLTCDAFDAVTRRCGVHEDRPPVCRDFPWYGQEPTKRGHNLPACCGYLADVGIEPEPVEVVLSKRPPAWTSGPAAP
jgi:Fe-S-cluster containining protein